MTDLDGNKGTSEKLVSAVAETASSISLQEADDSSSEELLDISLMQESISAGPGRVPHNIKLVAGASESASAQTLGEADVSSLEELNTASLQELVTASPRTAPYNNTLDGSSTTSPFRREKTVALRELDQELDLFLAEQCVCYSSSEDSTTTSPRAVEHNAIYVRNQRTLLRNTTDGALSSASSLGSKILSRRVPHCFYWYYIRMDHQGSFRTYPDCGGPFQSLQEAEDAIDRHHDGRWCRSWRDVQEADGGPPYLSTRKVSEVDTYRYLVQALLDQYNEDNNLIGNLAHELDEDDGMMEQWIYEDHSFYYHYNFTTKKIEAGDISLGACTFFAELSHKLGEYALEVNCCCKVEDEDNGWCYGCKNNGSHGMRHPKNLDAYTGGHLDVLWPCTLEEPSSSDDEETKETRLRNFPSEKHVAAVAESASALTLEDPDWDEFFEITSSEELIIASPQAEPHDPIDGSSTFPCDEKLLAGAVE